MGQKNIFKACGFHIIARITPIARNSTPADDPGDFMKTEEESFRTIEATGAIMIACIAQGL